MLLNFTGILETMLSATWRKHKGLSQASKEGRTQDTEKFLAVKNFHSCMSATKAQISKKSIKCSLIISWYIPHKRPNLPAISKMVLCLHSQFVNFQHVFHCVICGEMTSMLIIFGQFPHSSFMKTIKKDLFLWHCHQNLCWAFVSNAVY